MFKIAIILLAVGCVSGQVYKVCVQSDRNLCSNLDREGQAACEQVESRIDCALKLQAGTADFGVFNEEETLLLAQQQPADHRVVATIRDVSRTEPYAFEAVAIVPVTHTNGLQGLRNYNYCHPGLDTPNQRWSPRVLKEFENAVNTAAGAQCPRDVPMDATLDELHADRLADFFSGACRPGPWSRNNTVDSQLKNKHPKLCSLCGPTSNTTCSSYSIPVVSFAGENTNNRHIQALECMRTNGNAVAYVAWQHVREYFTSRTNANATPTHAVLCPDGSIQDLTATLLANATSFCAFVRQPWSTVVATSDKAAVILAALKSWWPNGVDPGTSWQSTVFKVVGGANARVTFDDSLLTPLNYTRTIREIPTSSASVSCQPARRWCTTSQIEFTKCNWVGAAAYTLGIEPAINCVQRPNIMDCLKAIKEDQADLIASSSNYGYLARQHYQLSPVKLLANSRDSVTKVAAFVKETSAQGNVTRFENLRGKKACFPEYGGIAYVAFVRTAHERGVIQSSQCDYARAVGEFFDSACAPGALDASHALSDSVSNYNATNLCSVCKPTITIVGNLSDFTCAWDFSNRYFGPNGTLACLADPATDIAVLNIQNITSDLAQLGLQPAQFRALCRNNTLAATTGVTVDENCLLAHTIDSEVVTRRNDNMNAALSVLLDNLDYFFGYTAESGGQLINMEIFSPFNGVNDLLFKDSAIGFTEPTSFSTNDMARNYAELFSHLDSCTSGAGFAALSTRNVYSAVMVIIMAMVSRFVVY